MSILTSSSRTSVSRGYYYYKDGKVKNIKQLNDFEFEGYVSGTMKRPYYVKINIKHPRKSYCECPYANGNIVCKHMVSLYFSIFPGEVDDYEAWMNSDYDDYDDDYDDYDDYDDDYDDYDDYDEYDDYYNEYHYSSSEKNHLFFDEVLEEYVNSLDTNQLRKILISELKQDEEKTFNFYLNEYYQKFLNSSNNYLKFLEKLNTKIDDFTKYYDFQYENFDKTILSSSEKKKIKEIYNDEKLRIILDKILLNEKLAVYSDYKWVCNFYKNNNAYIKEFIKSLDSYLNNLKHYSIRNDIPKANILICIYILSDYTEKDIAYSLYKNPKYLKYVSYVVNHNSLNLYHEYIKLINNNYLINKEYIPDVLKVFYYKFDNEEIRVNYLFYSFLCLKETNYLKSLNYLISENTIIKMTENKTKDVYTLMKLYKYFDKKEKLWNLLNNGNYNYLLLNNVECLRDKYNNELYNHFIDNFYNILKEKKSRDVYNKASVYIKAISELNGGDMLVKKIVADLKESDYKKCSALFDEIEKSIKVNIHQ